MTKAVAKKQETMPAAFLDDLTKFGQQYGEALGKDDMSIPFIQILQALSPQCTKGEAEYIKGAEPSMLYNTVTKEIMATQDDNGNQVVGMKVIALTYKASFIEWVPRAKGGGFVHEYDVAEGKQIKTALNDQRQDIIVEGSPYGTPGNQLVSTHTHFVFVLKPDGSWEPAVLTMSSTQIKPSKDWNALIAGLMLPNGQRSPRFYGVWNVTTRRRSNDHGSWFIWEFSKGGTVADLANGADVVRAAASFVDSVMAGEHNVDHAKAQEPSKVVAEDTDVPY